MFVKTHYIHGILPPYSYSYLFCELFCLPHKQFSKCVFSAKMNVFYSDEIFFHSADVQYCFNDKNISFLAILQGGCI